MSNTLYYPSGINTNPLAQVFNQLYSVKAMEIVRLKNGLLYAVMGKRWEDNEDDANEAAHAAFERLEVVTGNQIEIKLLGALDTISTVADGSAEIATVTPTYTANMFGGATFDLTHYYQNKAIPSSEYNRIGGPQAKTFSYVDDVFNQIMLSWENQIGNDMNGVNGVNNQARTTLGTWPYAVDDGTTYATYGNIDRSQSANANWASYVQSGVGDLTLRTIRLAMNTVATHGGRASFGIAETGVYTKIQNLTEQYTQAEMDADWNEFGGEYVKYGPTRYVLDERSPTGMLGLLDPESWIWYQRNFNFTSTGFIRAPHLVSAYVLPWEIWCGLICKHPARNAKLTGITS